MNVVRAMEVLGVQPGIEPVALRRAYLRKVRSHPPERDPTGFQELREAFELLQRIRWSSIEDGLDSETPEEALVANAPPVGEEPPAAEEPPAVEERLDAPEEPPRSRFAEQIDAVNRAIEADDPKAAARVLIDLYGRPLLESAPTPPPVITLRVYIRLVAAGSYNLAVKLFRAFEAYSERSHFMPIDGDTAARWRLAREIAAVVAFDSRLGRAAASALLSGDFSDAEDATERAFVEHGSQLKRHLEDVAPSIWPSLAVHLQSPRQAEAPLRKSGSRWSYGALIAVFWGLRVLAGLGTTSTPRSDTVYYSPPARPVPAVEQEASPEPEAAPPVLPDGKGAFPWPSSVPRPTSVASGSWLSIELALQAGDCATIREQWPSYSRSARDTHGTDHVRIEQRQRVLALCGELKDLLEEYP
jgi:hypothetical protein